MSSKWITIGQTEWALDGDAEDVIDQVSAAINSGTVAAVPVLDKHGRSITVCVNGKTVESVTFDLSGTPRPSEIM